MMTIMGKRFTNRGISTIIAALLLIAIAIAAGVLLYVFSIGLIGSLQGSGGQQVKDQVIMEAYNWQTSGSLVLNLRNTGSSTVNLQIADWYLGGTQLTTPASATSCSSTPTGNAYATVVPQGSCVVSLTATAGSYSSGVAYVVKLSLADGGVMSFSAIDGSAA
jgi:flagellin-like protein